ncbi:hypothetical protein JW935_22390 [candidate division KSB1 bacterium]|nr:hypothetical protein [candidate division KSB1 bacterium]
MSITDKDLALAKMYYENKNFSLVIKILEGNCDDLLPNDSAVAGCHMILGSSYLKEFMYRRVEIMDKNHKPVLSVGLKSNEYYLDGSISHFNEAIKLSRSKLTYKELHENKMIDIFIKSLIANAGNYLTKEYYSKAEQYLNEIRTIFTIYPSPNLEYFEWLKRYVGQFYTIIPKEIRIKLSGDINPILFSQPEIQPNISFEVKDTSGINRLHAEYIDQRGRQGVDLKLIENTFFFNKKLILCRKNSLLYPFESLYAVIDSIKPGRINNDTLRISLVGESSNIKGTAIFMTDSIKLIFERKPKNITKIVFCFILCIVSLVVFSSRIKTMRKASFEPKNLIMNLSFLFTLGTHILYVISDSAKAISILNIILILFIIITVRKFIIKRRRLFKV